MQSQSNAIAGQIPRPTQLQAETQRLNEAVATLVVTTDGLAVRLHPLLRGEPPSTASANEVREILVPAAEEIRRSAEQVQFVISAIESLIQRLEV